MSEVQMDFTGERYVPGKTALTTHLSHLHRYLAARQVVQGKTVLDIACGEGYGSDIMAEVASHVTGVDIAPDAIEHAKKAYPRDNLAFLLGSADKFPLEDASIDVVVSFETIEHHDKHDEMMSEIKRVLKPGGVMVMSSPDKKYYSEALDYHNEYHVKELYEEEFRELVGRYFKNAQYFSQRLMYGSVLFSAFSNPKLVNFREEEGGITQTDSLAEPKYHVVVASDGELPAFPAGIYEKPIDYLDYDNWQRIKKEYAEQKAELKPLQRKHRILEDKYGLAQMEIKQNRETIEKFTNKLGIYLTKLDAVTQKTTKLLHVIEQRDRKIFALQAELSDLKSGKSRQQIEYFDITKMNELNNSFQKRYDSAIVMHLYYDDLVDEIFGNYLAQMSGITDLFVTVPEKVPVATIDAIRRYFPNSYIMACENRGRDIRPFLQILPVMNDMGYKIVCKVHSKKSPQLANGKIWRDRLFQSMLSSTDNIANLVLTMAGNPSVGLLAPQFSFESVAEARPLENKKWLDELLTRLGEDVMINDYRFHFPAGSMYMARIEPLMKLTEVVSLDEFEPEEGQIDGTLAHAIERIVGLLNWKQEYQVGVINTAQKADRIVF